MSPRTFTLMTLRHALISLGAVALLAGCAGTNFKRPDQAALKLGSSTTADVVAAMGEPSRTGELTKNGSQIKRMSYSYATTMGVGLYAGVIPARSMTFSTADGKLVGQQYLSSFNEDGTDFDDSKVPQIVKGTTTRSDVVALLGRSTGESVYPLSKNPGEQAISYLYVHLRKQFLGASKLYTKSLTVSFDARDVVSDVEFSVSGEK
ncbi:hypothetical protein HLB44_15565 [Aquincola sp. S2]|uniref:Outer membrane protein assembly factor BamE n=1 Tax=Pseudaquabacterium terrae TaxID=2732868 RepID=A0ABX2EIF2_9BURK|nr:hypothetical protein [Aquabacterium terrae]NRF68412.1 hypothetical protein [Aquabacterium terrae]